MNDDAEFRGQLASLRETGTLCDAFISIPGETVKLPAHRVILASCSDFFRSLFTSGLRESVESDVNLHGVTLGTLRTILKYAYTKEVYLTSDNIEEIFEAADRFGVLSLLDDCIQFLISELTTENCIGILRFAKFYNSVILREASWVFLLNNFENVSKSQEFVQLQAEELLEILSDDNLAVNTEDDALAAMMNWVDFSPTERRQYYYSLLTTIRLPFVSEKYFTKTLCNKTFRKQNSNSWELIQRGQRFMQHFRAPNTSIIQSFSGIKFLTPRIPNRVIFVIGGWSTAGVTSAVETYDRVTNQWFDIKACELPTPRAYHAVVRAEGYIYAVGGYDGIHYLNSVLSLNPATQTWEERAPMYMSRCYVSVVEMDGIIYTCGGFDGHHRHRSAEKYNRQTNQWTLISPMNYNRSDAGASVHRGLLYVAGGFDGQSCLFTAEVYNPNSDQWTVLTSMVNRRSGVSLVTCQDQLYAIGGYDGMNRLRSVEYYDPARKTWLAAPSMHLGRSNFSAVVMDDAIYIMGGYDGDETSSRVEKYVPDKKVWSTLFDLNIGRSAVSACVMDGISNARDFTYHGNKSSNNEATCSGDASLSPGWECLGNTRRKRRTSTTRQTQGHRSDQNNA